jgi:hypothetical protein
MFCDGMLAKVTQQFNYDLVRFILDNNIQHHRIAHAAIEEETRYSVCAEEAFKLYLKTLKEKEKKKL